MAGPTLAEVKRAQRTLAELTLRDKGFAPILMRLTADIEAMERRQFDDPLALAQFILAQKEA